MMNDEAKGLPDVLLLDLAYTGQRLIEKHLTFDIHHSLFNIRYSLFGPAIGMNFSGRRQLPFGSNGY